MPPYLVINNLRVVYDQNVILSGFNLELEKGCIYSLIGPSGCGKSTLLKTIGGIIKPKEGSVLLEGKPLAPDQHSIGYIPQNFGLLDWLTVGKNLSVAERIRRVKPEHKEQILEQLDIAHLLDRYPRQLSGGQQQRVAIARAWMLQPQLLLMDEPFSSLDSFTSERSRELFLSLWKEQKTTTLFVTHNLQEAVRMGRYLILLSGQPASVVEIIENPLFRPGTSRGDIDFFHYECELREKIKERNLIYD